MRIIGLIGPPTSGKTTLSQALATEAYIFRLRREVTPDQLVTRDGSVKSWIEDDVAAYVLERAVAREQARGTELFICDNFPGNAQQVDLLAEVCRGVCALRVLIVCLQIPLSSTVIRAERRRVCNNCECDPLNEPRIARDESAHLAGVCNGCGESLQARASDAPERLKMRLERYRQHQQEIELRSRLHRINYGQIDATGPTKLVENAIRFILANDAGLER